MNRHPGGEEQTIHLLKSIELKKGMKALDLGAGEGETVRQDLFQIYWLYGGRSTNALRKIPPGFLQNQALV